MATGQFTCGCNSIIMAIKLLEYMGDTVGLSLLQIIISQKADNWGSIGSVKTVIGEMGHWEAPLWELLMGGAVIWWTDDAISVQLMGRQLEAFLLHSWESWQKIYQSDGLWWWHHHSLGTLMDRPPKLTPQGLWEKLCCFKWIDGCPGFWDALLWTVTGALDV